MTEENNNHKNKAIAVDMNELIVEDSLRPTLQRNLQLFIAASAENTKKNLARVMRHYQVFCYQNQCLMFPLQEETVLAFIDYRVSMGVLLRTINTDVHLLKSLDASILNQSHSSIGDSRLVGLALKPRQKNGDPAKKKAYPIHHQTIDEWYSSNQSRHDDFDFIRANAIFRVAYDGLLRISEIESLTVASIRFKTSRLFLPFSKTDKDAEGAYLYLSEETLSAVKRWIGLLSVTESDPLFWSFFAGKAMKLRGPLKVVGIYNLIKKELGLACSGHSFRIGACEDMTEMGINEGGIMNAGRWKDPKMPAHYAAEINAGKSGMAEMDRLRKARKNK